MPENEAVNRFHCFINGHLSGNGCNMVENLKSVNLFHHIVKEKLNKEVSKGRMAGPFKNPPFINFRILPLGIIQKKEHNSYRLIHHLSYPEGASLNDEIEESLSSVSYCTFAEAVFKIRKFGRAALLAKINY